MDASRGEYMVSISVGAPGDVDTANNAELVYVLVEDWYDIEVDLVWVADLGNGSEELESSVLMPVPRRQIDFKLKVTNYGLTPLTHEASFCCFAPVAKPPDPRRPNVDHQHVVAGTDTTVDTFQNKRTRTHLQATPVRSSPTRRPGKCPDMLCQEPHQMPRGN